MDNSRNRVQPLLVGIGLVLVGLLSGILVMLFIVDGQVVPTAPAPIVERVELGGKSALPQPVSPDSGQAPVLMDPVGLNGVFRDVAQQVTPAVVYIQVEAGSGQDEIANWFRDRGTRQSVGSGVLISDQGHIITNNHVVEGARHIQVMLDDKRQYPAKIIGLDPQTDLAVIQVDTEEQLPLIRFGDSDQVQVGEWVLAVGNPFRLTSTVTAGIVSALGRQVDIIGGDFGIEDFIQTDAAINPGNSGGALVNLKGELIGISTAIATESGSYEGYGFAVPVNLMSRVAEDLIAFGKVQRGYLGVSIDDVNAYVAERLEMDQIRGVYLLDVFENGPAYAAGLRQGDVVLTIEGRDIGAPNELQSALARFRPGDAVALEVWRVGGERSFRVVLFGQDDPAYSSWSVAMEQQRNERGVPELPPNHPSQDVIDLAGWGVGLRDLGPRERNGFGIQDGAYVAYVEKESPAEQAGLPHDIVLVEANGVPIKTVGDVVAVFEMAAEEEETVLVRARRRDGLTAFYEIDVPLAQ